MESINGHMEYFNNDNTFTYYLGIIALIMLLTYMYLNYQNESKTVLSEMSMEELGRSSWAMLHTIAAKYPVYAPENMRRAMRDYLASFSEIYPCSQCSN